LFFKSVLVNNIFLNVIAQQVIVPGKFVDEYNELNKTRSQVKQQQSSSFPPLPFKKY